MNAMCPSVYIYAQAFDGFHLEKKIIRIKIESKKCFASTFPIGLRNKKLFVKPATEHNPKWSV